MKRYHSTMPTTLGAIIDNWGFVADTSVLLALSVFTSPALTFLVTSVPLRLDLSDLFLLLYRHLLSLLCWFIPGLQRQSILVFRCEFQVCWLLPNIFTNVHALFSY